MMSIAAIYAWLLWLSVLVVLFLTVGVGVSMRGKSAARRFFLVITLGFIWVSCSALSVVSSSEEWAARWFLFHYAAMGFAAPAMLWFMLGYLGRPRAFRAYDALPWIVPTLIFITLCVDPSKFFREATFVRHGSFFLIDSYVPGWAYWVHTVYGYILMGTAYCLIFAALVSRSRAPYLRQTLLLFAGASLMGGTNITTRAGLLGPDVVHLDWSGAVTGLSSALWYIAIFRYGLLDLMPVARDVLVETMRDGMLVVDNDERIVDANPAIRSLLDGASPVGAPLEEVLPPELQVHPVGGEEVSEEIEIVLPHGTRQFDLRALRLEATTGEAIGRLIVLQDVTERARMIQDLDAYARVVAHDLKNPIGVIAGYAEMLREEATALSDKDRELIGIIIRTCGTMTKIINELLLMASVRGAEHVEMAELDMGEIVGSVRARLEPLIASSAAEVVVPDAWPAARGQAAWVEEAWVNYVSNAIKYGGTPPRVELGSEPGDDGIVRFWVRDNGEGLDDDQRAKLFEEFQRFAPEKVDGHGLGLSIVRRIAEKLGGNVGADSEPGKGSTFWFSLPSAAGRERRGTSPS